MFKKLFSKKPDGPMFRLMIYEESFEPVSIETSFGGQPVFNQAAEFQWPACRTCNGNMQYLGRIADGQYLNLIFMCQNEPGLCDEWEPAGGGNKVIRFQPTSLESIIPPETGDVSRQTEYGCQIVEYTDQSYNDARANWAKKKKKSPRVVLGQVGGEPEWLQADETPVCESCSENMRFVAQLEQGPDYKTEMNFGGGGCAYLFACDTCADAKFLWQC